MSIIKDLDELVAANLISADAATAIRAYYAQKDTGKASWPLLVFSILGAVLVGLGLILIIAHNWDTMSRGLKLFFAFLPLLLAQALSAFTLLRRADKPVWRETSAVLLFFSVGASISLVSQIYHIEGELKGFMLIWALLCLPISYLLRSSAASLLYLGALLLYLASDYLSITEDAYVYWGMLGLSLPYYYQLQKRSPNGPFAILHHWLLPVAATAGVLALVSDFSHLLVLVYSSGFALFYFIGSSSFMNTPKLWMNGFKAIGSLGTAGLLLFLSFDFFWDDLANERFPLSELLISVEGACLILITALAVFFRARQLKGQPLKSTHPMSLIFLSLIPTFILGTFISEVLILINFLMLGLGVYYIRRGAQAGHLGLLNYGLIVIASLVTARFFDQDLSFVWRGVLFVLVGGGFFVLNYMTLKSRRAHEG